MVATMLVDNLHGLLHALFPRQELRALGRAARLPLARF
jgi:hypothetical protein